MTTAATRPALTGADIADFRRDGFVIKRRFLADDQIAALCSTLANDPALRSRTWTNDDGSGDAVELSAWNEPGDDSFGALARNERLVGAVAGLLDDEPYHYHSKLNSKRPGAGGTWVWHQDFGYWYHHCAYPDMLTVAVPLTATTPDNGCLQVLRGSHRAGRIEHLRIGEQTGAAPERVADLVARHETVRFEAEPGDLMLFHCNLLHTSEPNRSESPRDLLLVAYNSRHNEPVRVHHHPGYSPIELLADSAVVERGGRIEGEHRTFIRPRRDRADRDLDGLG